MSKSNAYSLGLDYGTNSVRAILVDVHTGEELVESVFPYPSGKDGILTDGNDPNRARQNPSDYIRGFEVTAAEVVVQALKSDGFASDRVVGIGLDTPGSTPIPVDHNGLPLAMQPEFGDNLDAQAWLWKDHSAYAEASEITELAQRRGVAYLEKCGGTYSSEWF